MALTQDEFAQLLEDRLGEFWDRAQKVFEGYGEYMSFDVANVLLQAVDKQKVGEVLDLLEKHYEEHIVFQHPDIRGQVSKLGVNPTQQLFLSICKNTLGLTPRS